jgi:NAD-dependent DNA ligase
MGVFGDSDVSVLERDFFQKHIAAGIINPTDDIEMVLELKYDGISIEADCSDEVISARSRGDTGIGVASDMTPILAGYKFPQHCGILDRTIGVKFEAIMTKSDLYRFNLLRGTTYANCRTAIIGLFGASDANKYRDLITLVPLAVDREQVPEIHNRIEEIEFANRLFRKNGEPLRYMYIHGNVNELLYQIKKFADEAYAFRDYVDFMFDGIVVSYLDENIRAKLGRKNFINKYSMAVKFNPETKLTYFTGYTFEVGQDGRICPMIHYNPIEFFGTIHINLLEAAMQDLNS